MNTNEIRKKYLEFFKKRGHSVISSASLLPENDSTTLFTGSGMQPLLPYLLGEKHPEGTRIADSQKCFRAEDIEEVGDNRHTTFFEMLGNWSLGDYWKEDQLKWFFDFLTQEIGISKDRLWVTCFEGDDALNLSKDTESVKIWQELGIPKERIYFYGAEKNWWSRAGVPSHMPTGEPGGPDSEMFYEFTSVEHDDAFGKECHPNCDCGRFMEIGNSVFMQYIKQESSSFKELEQKNVDFGGGLERIVAAANDNPDIFEIDIFAPIIKELEKCSDKLYTDIKLQKSFRIIADHIRGAVFMVGDGVLPSNTESGYVLRRLLRRCVRHMDVIGVGENILHTLVAKIAQAYADEYPTLLKKQEIIIQEIQKEEQKFKETLSKGLREFEKRLQKGSITGEDVFTLYTSYGFPQELTRELVEERGAEIVGDSSELFREHREISKKGAEQKFKGGLADHDEMSVKYHTATHLLQSALREVLGDQVYQKGSNITGERLRFDFSHDTKMTDEEKQKVEDIVNQKIREGLEVSYEDLALEEAEKLGAIGLFGEKYGDLVRVYKIGDYSLEYCGGPHVKNTSELGNFKIKKESAVSAGVRRIKAIF